ncbi:hypothetical protein PAPYR_289 [Paratrimastix pyriformis]|uniref:Uncharacterized protein n=1 Tax=Paratrimastix pyriformis TaxID=342808 RepID=A0ABQ8UVY1_9EUKA|nr:hypothetical protein PAPYR_289 [Paratrimastix pyriformis]
MTPKSCQVTTTQGNSDLCLLSLFFCGSMEPESNEWVTIQRKKPTPPKKPAIAAPPSEDDDEDARPVPDDFVIGQPILPGRTVKRENDEEEKPKKKRAPKAKKLSNQHEAAELITQQNMGDAVAQVASKYHGDASMALKVLCDTFSSSLAGIVLKPLKRPDTAHYFEKFMQTPIRLLDPPSLEPVQRYIIHRDEAELLETMQAIVDLLAEPGQMGKPAMVGVKIFLQLMLRVRPDLALHLIERRLPIFTGAPPASGRPPIGQQATLTGTLGTGPGSVEEGMSLLSWVLGQAAYSLAPDGLNTAFDGWCRYLVPALLRHPRSEAFRIEVRLFGEQLQAIQRGRDTPLLSAALPQLLQEWLDHPQGSADDEIVGMAMDMLVAPSSHPDAPSAEGQSPELTAAMLARGVTLTTLFTTLLEMCTATALTKPKHAAMLGGWLAGVSLSHPTALLQWPLMLRHVSPSVPASLRATGILLASLAACLQGPGAPQAEVLRRLHDPLGMVCDQLEETLTPLAAEAKGAQAKEIAAMLQQVAILRRAVAKYRPRDAKKASVGAARRAAKKPCLPVRMAGRLIRLAALCTVGFLCYALTRWVVLPRLFPQAPPPPPPPTWAQKIQAFVVAQWMTHFDPYVPAPVRAWALRKWARFVSLTDPVFAWAQVHVSPVMSAMWANLTAAYQPMRAWFDGAIAPHLHQAGARARPYWNRAAQWTTTVAYPAAQRQWARARPTFDKISVVASPYVQKARTWTTTTAAPWATEMVGKIATGSKEFVAAAGRFWTEQAKPHLARMKNIPAGNNGNDL